MIVAKYTAVKNDIKFAMVLVQELEERRKSLTMKCWKARVECYCISVDLPSYLEKWALFKDGCFSIFSELGGCLLNRAVLNQGIMLYRRLAITFGERRDYIPMAIDS